MYHSIEKYIAATEHTLSEPVPGIIGGCRPQKLMSPLIAGYQYINFYA